MALHPDFDTPWCSALLADPSLEYTELISAQFLNNSVSMSIFAKTLHTDSAIRAHLYFRRLCNEPDAAFPTEYCSLMSIGDALDGKIGRAHGGFTALVLDQVSGSAAGHPIDGPLPPATAYLNIRYKAPIGTPGVVLARAWVTEVSGRKIFVKALLENGEGHVYGIGSSLFIDPQPSVPSKL